MSYNNLTPLGLKLKKVYLLIPTYLLVYPFTFIYYGFKLAKEELDFSYELKQLWKIQFNKDE